MIGFTPDSRRMPAASRSGVYLDSRAVLAALGLPASLVHRHEDVMKHLTGWRKQSREDRRAWDVVATGIVHTQEVLMQEPRAAAQRHVSLAMRLPAAVLQLRIARYVGIASARHPATE